MQPINPSTTRFIKLGRNGKWEADCIEGEHPVIRLGFVNPHHQACLAGDWGTLRTYWAKHRTKGKTTEITNQIKSFYTLDENTLWITFYRRRLYWCFASPEVQITDDGTRTRSVIGRWSSQSIRGEELLIENLSGGLTKTQGFRGTICSIGEEAYLIRRINGLVSPAVEEARASLCRLERALADLIRALGWKDFELLCDLIFTQSGWQRLSTVGGTEKSIDLDLLAPVSGKRAFVQIKSQSDKSEFEDYCQEFTTLDQYDEMFFVVHSPMGDVTTWNKPEKAQIMLISDIARLAVAAGLSKWIIQKNT